ncbi:Hypothetical predicted protein, partial [Olea europaea subsp. europaea]
VQERFEVDIKELPEQIDTSTYSKYVYSSIMFTLSHDGVWTYPVSCPHVCVKYLATLVETLP